MKIAHDTVTETPDYFPHGIPMTEAARRWHTATVSTSESESLSSATPFRFARSLAACLNQHADAVSDGRPARAGELLAMMLLNKIARHLIRLYCNTLHPGVIDNGLAYVSRTRGPETVAITLPAYVRHYPPHTALADSHDPQAFLAAQTNELRHWDLTFTELLIVQLAHENPALKTYRFLFDNHVLRRAAPYDLLVEGVDEWLATQPPFPDTSFTLLQLLREPIRNSPDSLEGQIEYIMKRWRAWLPEALLEQLLLTRGVLREETMMRGLGPGPASTLAFHSQDYEEPEAFSQDEDWMPHVVLIAKLAYVWLDQLSKQYNRVLTTLSDIPDEELDRLAAWGFNALWLIGVWERSPASREIKQRMGNPEAASSAYSLYDYVIAEDLGGEAAFHDLATRARMRGIRLAGDMVPNHVGLYSRWVVEHPDWFLQLRESPFPGYTFNGPDLSSDDRVGLYIEDGYWNHSDAAVVFKRVDNHTGDVRYIYHGNDGTSMPWNDTAQLNFLSAETREAVINTIVHVARMFPIIRFDAAMTLAKRHYQRLWFPRPGEGGAIPSRAEHGLDKDAFDQVFPAEFWREVVDRIAAEAPDTLLLAEAFWLMEGYFVRTLGMHRVYNSAFMNMLKLEENDKYRQTIKNVLEFSPAVLQRFVNFMNNPDEDTAQAQFGKGDKYFGVAIMLATMPGLPMFGHGQVEGYAEKYGMEYRRAYHEETPDTWLIERHEREVFPLLRKRYLFSGADHFALFDFVTPDGWVDENVFAYSNRVHDERALIVYNNAYNTTRGVLHTSTAINEARGDDQRLRRRPLAETLHLNTDPRYYVILRDERTRLEYLRHNATIAEQGLHFELQAYEYKAFIHIRQICDNDNSWGRLHQQLGDQGVPDMEEAYIEMHLAEILEPFRAMMTSDMPAQLLGTKSAGAWQETVRAFVVAVAKAVGTPDRVPAVLADIEECARDLRAFCAAPAPAQLPQPVRTYLLAGLPDADASPEERAKHWRSLAVYCLLRPIGALGAAPEADVPIVEGQTAGWMRSWLLVKHIARAFAEADNDDGWQAQQDAWLAYGCMAHRERLLSLDSEIWGPVLYAMFEDGNTRAILQVNRFNNRRWLNKEQLEHFMHTLFLCNALALQQTGHITVTRLMMCYENIQDILHAASDTGYDMDHMLEALR